jgi:DNA repair exonuclease SbcCD ATPase subunit
MTRLPVIIFLFLLVPTWIASAELTKDEVKEIQAIMRQELQHVDKRFDDMLNSVNKRFDDINKRFDSVDKRFDDVNNRFNDMNNRINDVNDRIDNIADLLLWGFGVLFAGMFALVGFVIWDRRTALTPAIRKNKELQEKQEQIEKALQEFALEEPKLAEILKRMGL